MKLYALLRLREGHGYEAFLFSHDLNKLCKTRPEITCWSVGSRDITNSPAMVRWSSKDLDEDGCPRFIVEEVPWVI